MKIKDVINVINTAESVELSTYGVQGFPEIRAFLNLANPKKYPGLKDKAIHVDGETFTLYLSTNTSSRKIRQIRENNKCCLYYVLPAKFKGISIIGTMEEITDIDIKKDFRQPNWTMYYHKGYTDPDYTLLKFTSKHLHCWGGMGIHDFGEKLQD